MGMTVEDLTFRLNAEAERLGMSPSRLLEQLSSQLPTVAEEVQTSGPVVRRHLAFAGVGSSNVGVGLANSTTR
jgi:uncharacterized protein YidB (DUF937 family)